MSRLRYPFTEVSARCRLCGAEGLTASSEHALGGRLIDWRRSHAPVCPEWPRWAEKKGLRLDERGALLYPNETGPYEPRIRPKADEPDADEDNPAPDADAAPDATIDAPTLAHVEPLDAAEGDAVAPAVHEERAEPEAGGRAARARRGALWVVPNGPDNADPAEARDLADAGAEEWPEPLPLPLGVGAASNRAKGAKSAKASDTRPRPTAREVDLMQVPVEHLRQAELF